MPSPKTPPPTASSLTGPLHRPLDSQADGQALGDGPAREALRGALQRLEQAEAQPSPAALCQALTDTARALANLLAYSPAESCLTQALRWAHVMGAADLQADLRCALAEVATNVADLAQARREPAAQVRRARDRARDQAFEATRLAALTSDPHWEVKVLLRASDVLDRCGDRDDALQLQQRALALIGLQQEVQWPDGSRAAAEPSRDPWADAGVHRTLM